VLALFRLVLTCLLAIALPLKATAALTMPGCAPGHPGAGQSERVHAAAGAYDRGSTLADGGRRGSLNDLAGHTGHAGDEPGDGQGAGHHHGAKVANAKCSSCTPCCAPAAPAPDAPRLVGTETALDARPFAAAAYRGVVADVPHKPPRITPA
jgi:hypothetical protein